MSSSTTAPSGTPGVSLIGLPYQFGRRADGHGYQMARGPEVLLAAEHLPQALAGAGYDVAVDFLDDLDDPEWPTPPGARPMAPGDQMVRQLLQNNGLSRAVSAARRAGRFPLIVAGGCNSSIGVVGGLDDPTIGLIWFDAHADAETPDTSSDGLFEGMPVSVIAGRCWPLWRARIEGFHEIPEDRIVQVGLHDRAFAEDDTTPYGIGHLVDPAAVERHGYEAALRAAVSQLAGKVRKVYVHIDADVIDARHLRASLHVAEGGPTPDQLRWSLDHIAGELEIVAVSFSSYDTQVDPNAPQVLVPLAVHVVGAAVSSAKA